VLWFNFKGEGWQFVIYNVIELSIQSTYRKIKRQQKLKSWKEALSEIKAGFWKGKNPRKSLGQRNQNK